MSKIALEGNASGTGTFTVASPNSNTNRTLTLPDNTGTIVTSASSITASQLPAGTILQVVSLYDATTSSSSGSYANIFGSNLSITLSSLSNKIYLLVTSPLSTASNSGGAADVGANMRIVRQTSGSAVELVVGRIRAQSLNDFNSPFALSYEDSSFAALTQTYNVQFSRYGGNDAAFTQYTQFIAMEIKA
jgi:hypothetical protein